MAHNQWSLLKKLIHLLDDPCNDVFLHIDKSAYNDQKKNGFSEALQEIQENLRFSKLEIVDPVKVYWASFSEVQAEFRLLEAVASSDEYSYCHLLSGVDLPLKTNRQWYDFFENSGKNFIAIVPKQLEYSVRRVKYFHPLLHNSLYRKHKILKAADLGLEYIQRAIGINRIKGIDWKIIDGWQWFSIKHDVVLKLLEKKSFLEKMFRHTIAGTELFPQTFVFNTPSIYETLFDVVDLKRGSMRYIDWTRGRPYVWGGDENDYSKLMKSPYMFARKFDERNDWIINRIFDELTLQQSNQ